MVIVTAMFLELACGLLARDRARNIRAFYGAALREGG
jgi:hypothetical protein